MPTLAPLTAPEMLVADLESLRPVFVRDFCHIATVSMLERPSLLLLLLLLFLSLLLRGINPV